MKRSTLIIAALAAFALGGCDMGTSSSTSTHYVRVQTTETVTTADGTDTYVIKIKYNEWGYVSEETTTKNGRPWRVMKDYRSGTNGDGFGTMSCTRETINDDGSTDTHTLVATYGAYYETVPLETRFEVLTTGTTPTAIEWRTVEYEGNHIKRYDSWTAEGGLVTRTDFRYANSPKPIETFTEVRNGGTPVRVGIVTTQFDVDLKPLEYKMYRNIPEGAWDGEPGENAQLIEERADYGSDLNKNSWTNLKYEYDADGVRSTVSTTEVENEYQNLTFTMF